MPGVCQRNSICTEIFSNGSSYVPVVICGCILKFSEAENTLANFSVPPTLLRLLFLVN